MSSRYRGHLCHRTSTTFFAPPHLRDLIGSMLKHHTAASVDELPDATSP